MNMDETISKRGGGSEAPRLVKRYQASFLELYLFAMLVFGKAFTFWQTGFMMGYWEFTFCVVLISVTYICFSSSVAEMISILPFSGGSYGYVRCVLGPFVGYLVGAFESVEYVMFVAATLVSFGSIMTTVCQTHANTQPLFWLIFYLGAVPLHMSEGSWFWRASSFMSLWIIFFIIIYCLGNAPVAHLTIQPRFSPTAMNFIHYFSVGGWGFKGIEIMTLTCDNTSNPARRVPLASMSAILSMILLICALVFIFGSIAPGITALETNNLPLTAGSRHIFGINDHFLVLLFAPAVLGSSYCFLFAATKQIHAMANSSLIPSIFKMVHGENSTPLVALIAVTVVSYIVQVVLFYGSPDEYVHILFTISMMSSLPAYLCLMIAYVVYSRKFSNLERAYRSVLGIPGAVFSFSVFAFASVTLIVFPKEVTISTSFIVVYLVLAIIYYFRVAESSQCFSTEEQIRFLKVYVANISRRKREGKGKLTRSRSRRGWKGFLIGVILGPNFATVYLSSNNSDYGGKSSNESSHRSKSDAAHVTKPTVVTIGERKRLSHDKSDNSTNAENDFLPPNPRLAAVYPLSEPARSFFSELSQAAVE